MLGRPAIITHATSAVTLDAVVNTLDDPTSAGLASMITALGTGVEGQGHNIDQAISALPTAMSQLGALSKILDQQNGVLNQFIQTAVPSAQAFATGKGAAVAQLVAKANQTLATVAQERQAMDATLNSPPP